MSHRRQIKPAYVWGALSNTEPPDDDEDVVCYYGEDDVTDILYQVYEDECAAIERDVGAAQ